MVTSLSLIQLPPQYCSLFLLRNNFTPSSFRSSNLGSNLVSISVVALLRFASTVTTTGNTQLFIFFHSSWSVENMAEKIIIIMTK